MILITGTVVVTPENRAAFCAVADAHVAKSRAEPGCVSYHVCEDVMAPGAFVFVEKWRDQEAVAAHFAKDYSHYLVQEMRRLATNDPQIEIHEIASTRVVTPGR